MGSSNDNDPKHSFWTFLKSFSALLLGFLTIVVSISTFTKPFLEDDMERNTRITLSVAILFIIVLCSYFAFVWKPEQQDEGQSGLLLLSDKQVPIRAKKEQNRKRIRLLATIGLFVILILSLSGIAGWLYVQSLPSKNIIVLVADFDGVEPKRYRVTKNIQESLEEAIKPYTNVEVKSLNQTINDKQSARVMGEQQKASIVIWGDYGVTSTDVQVSVNFEVLKPPDYFPKLGKTAKGEAQTSAIAELNSFRLQTRLSKEMSYLTLFTVGMVQYPNQIGKGPLFDSLLR